MSDEQFVRTVMNGVHSLKDDFKKAIRHFEVGDEDAMEECGDGLTELANACRNSPIFSVIMMKVMDAGFNALFSDEENVEELLAYCKRIKKAYQ